jgi:hypothetical protein
VNEAMNYPNDFSARSTINDPSSLVPGDVDTATMEFRKGVLRRIREAVAVIEERAKAGEGIELCYMEVGRNRTMAFSFNDEWSTERELACARFVENAANDISLLIGIIRVFMGGMR